MKRVSRLWMAGTLLALAAGGAVAAAFEASKDQWSLVTDVQKYYRCLPFSWYVVIRTQAYVTPRRGELVQFKAPTTATELGTDYDVIKIVAGIPGDRWRISNDQLYINGSLWGELYMMSSIGAASGSMDGQGVVPEGTVYVLGTNPSSYDSRYWGELPISQINGRAHVLF